MPDPEPTITLTFNHNSGQWIAGTGDGWEADGATPLDAVMSLAQQMRKALNRMEENPNA